MYAALHPGLLLALALGVNAEKPAALPKKPKAREVVVLASAAQEGKEPALVLLCAGADGKLKHTGCRGPLPGTKARRPKEGEHTVGRPKTAAACELSRLRLPAVDLDPAPPRGPALFVWPSSESALVTPAEDLATRVPDVKVLEALQEAVGGTPIIDQALALDLDHDEKEDRLFSARRKDGGAELVLFSGESWRKLPLPAGARAVRLLAVSDLDRDRHDELYLFVQLEAGWELSVIAADREAPLASLRCASN